MKKISRKEWLLHIAFWVVLLVAVFGFFNQFINGSRAAFLAMRSVIVWGLVAYINILYLIPLFFERRRFTLYFLSALLLAGVLILLVDMLVKWFFPDLFPDFIGRVPANTNFSRERTPKVARFLAQFLMANAVLFMSTLYQLSKTFSEKEKLSALLEKEKVQHELNFLRSQINPHFLFNALNNLYATVQINPQKSEKYILKLGEMLRYVLEECKKDKVNLVDEIDYIRNYIFFQQQRDEQLANINFNTYGPSPGDFEIEPMLFIALVENAFHHSRNIPVEEQLVDIRLELTPQELKFEVKNNLGALGLLPQKEGFGIGLKNIKRRLELKYHEAHQLNTKRQGNMFIAQLIINQ